MICRRLGDDHGVTGCSVYSPRADPLVADSELTPIVFDTFTGYKNRKFGAICRSAGTEAINFRLADNAVGVKLTKNMQGGYQRLKDSIIVGGFITGDHR